MEATAKIQKNPRTFLPEDFTVTTWDALAPYFEDLKLREVSNKEELNAWLKDISELEAVISEDASWRQIKMTIDTTNREYEDAFTYFCLEIEPKMKPYFFEINKKLLASPFKSDLPATEFFPYLRNVDTAVNLYRDENVPIQAELSVLAQQYGTISGQMTIEVESKEYTLQQAARFLQKPDRKLREEVYRKISARRLQDKDKLNELFDKLLAGRQQVAKNAGFDNYRDYKFKELGRFDYTPEDCFEFH